MEVTKDMIVTPELCPEIHQRLMLQPLAEGFQIGFCEGFQRFADFNSCLSLFVIRLPKVNTDIAIQLNVAEQQPEEALASMFLRTLASFSINDWTLFEAA
eukprot:Protomagalhaensia_wolfi_Nauph_80__2695@NODE_2825_length_976_cov_254_756670_g2216_i0_p2_GENE_NODE_2825_length_976_cov_254_756670_g2216_i0NODE_2825_length_976_cov_254_756670_g2216_i0_p2_ORF_typecomplete_len100_score26_85Yae1_N/PF09811_9/0_023Mog1/PF04603_12/0_16_NODE_2825_length_976_cov_254_756670_g2216_i0375674